MNSSNKQSSRSNVNPTDSSTTPSVRTVFPFHGSAEAGGEKPKFKVTRSPFAPRSRHKFSEHKPTSGVMAENSPDLPLQMNTERPPLGSITPPVAPQARPDSLLPLQGEQDPKPAYENDLSPVQKSQLFLPDEGGFLGITIDVIFAIVATAAAVLMITNLIKYID